MTWLPYLLTAAIGYLLGCSSMALYLSKIKGVDMRASGSGNLGASNAMVLMGWSAGVLVAVHDIGKAIIAVLLAQWFWPQAAHIGAVAGIACVLGHMFPFYLRFKGGKGLASYIGLTIALNWKFALVVMLIVALVTLITDYIVIGTVTTVIIVPAYLSFMAHSLLLLAILGLGTSIILYKHRENYRRILNGTEIGLRRAHRGDDRQV